MFQHVFVAGYWSRLVLGVEWDRYQWDETRRQKSRYPKYSTWKKAVLQCILYMPLQILEVNARWIKLAVKTETILSEIHSLASSKFNWSINLGLVFISQAGAGLSLLLEQVCRKRDRQSGVKMLVLGDKAYMQRVHPDCATPLQTSPLV